MSELIVFCIAQHNLSIISQIYIKRIINNIYNKLIQKMNIFNKFKTYLKPHNLQQKCMNNEKQASQKIKSMLSNLSASNDSYQLIMLDILNDLEVEEKSQVKQEKSQHKKSQQIYENLIFDQAEHQEIQNIYIKDFIFVNKLSEARELTVEEWNAMIKQKNISLYPKKNLYFSIFKGIKFEVRKNAWELFANTAQMKKLATRPYKQLINPLGIRPQIVTQIQKDVPRTRSITNYLLELKNILIAYCALTRKQYTQGMNLIAGSLLTLLALENDQQLSSFQIVEKQFEERVFWIFIGVMVWKNWQDIFDKDLYGLTKRLQILENLMAQHVPAVYQKLIDYEWDLTIFSQYYITIMMYNTPKDFSKIILDLFFLDGQNALHSLIIRMMKLQQDKILGFSDQCQLMNYFKKEMIVDCYLSIKKNQTYAKKLQDFQINFMKSTKG